MQGIQVEMQNLAMNKGKIQEKRNENELVLKELELLEEDANVYKLVGPIMAKQDLEESKTNVKSRIQYLDTEV